MRENFVSVTIFCSLVSCLLLIFILQIMARAAHKISSDIFSMTEED